MITRIWIIYRLFAQKLYLKRGWRRKRAMEKLARFLLILHIFSALILLEVLFKIKGIGYLILVRHVKLVPLVFVIGFPFLIFLEIFSSKNRLSSGRVALIRNCLRMTSRITKTHVIICICVSVLVGILSICFGGILY